MEGQRLLLVCEPGLGMVLHKAISGLFARPAVQQALDGATVARLRCIIFRNVLDRVMDLC